VVGDPNIVTLDHDVVVASHDVVVASHDFVTRAHDIVVDDHDFAIAITCSWRAHESVGAAGPGWMATPLFGFYGLLGAFDYLLHRLGQRRIYRLPFATNEPAWHVVGG
jgi:hypothetical protein